MLDQKDWSTIRDRAGSIHVIPNNDLAEHPRSWMCGCRPVFNPIEQSYGDWGWVFTHEALDGRLD